MKIVHKDATITPTGNDDDFPGTFRVILSAPSLDRDGDTLATDEWKIPLPERITFDSDHGMSVSSMVGSGHPFINEKGELEVEGTFSRLPRAQDVRTLAIEGHLTTTSVAYMTLPKATKDAKTQRELLNGAFVAIPANRDALILSSKAGARNSTTDAQRIQQIHDLAVQLGAATDGGVPDAPKSFISIKDADPDDLISGIDAALDEALALVAETDLTVLPAEVQQAFALLQAASSAADKLLEDLGLSDPDDSAETAAEVGTAAAEKSAAAANTQAADEAESDAVTAKALAEQTALLVQAAQFS